MMFATVLDGYLTFWMMRKMCNRDIYRRVIIVGTAAFVLLLADQFIRWDFAPVRAYDLDSFSRKQAAWQLLPEGSIALLGSSRAFYGLVPDEFERATGCQTYSFGIAATKPAEWLALAKRTFTQTPPALVVLGVNAEELQADYEPTVAARHLFEWDDCFDHCARFGWSSPVAGTYSRCMMESIFQVFQKRFEIRMWLQNEFGDLLPSYAEEARLRRNRVDESCAPDGFAHPWLSGRDRRNLEERLSDPSMDVKEWPIPLFDANAPSLAYFEDLLDWLERNGSKVLVAYLPNSPRAEQRWLGIEPRFIKEVEQRCHRRGIEFVQFNCATLPRVNRDYVDEVHMGLDIAHRISREIARHATATMQPRSEQRLADGHQGG